MAKTSAIDNSPPSKEDSSYPISVSKSSSPEVVEGVHRFFNNVGISAFIPENNQSKDFYSDILRYLLKAASVQRGRISCVFSVQPVVANYYGGLHGSAVAAIAERVGIACARTIVAEDKEIFLGELSISYLSAAPQKEVLVVDGSVVRSGRNLTVVAMEFKIKRTGKLGFTARATFYHMPPAKL
ncbi:hypothetical protein JCGZ_14444 [Jatropha curcas]|uniref:Thioesterase domain-containing protein n=1 Tax=Jatropha curcas TaxID=180498 RepID=A0A067K0U6_JATCU|nr:hypothetical protein JCGZ_14444 [Jatropha curcas]